MIITYGQVLNQKTTTNSKIPSNSVYSIDFDDNGNVYAGTTEGVYRYNKNNPNDEATYNLATSTSTARTVSYIKCVNGNVIAGRLNGVSIFNGTTWTNHNVNMGSSSGYVTSYAPTNSVTGVDFCGGVMGLSSNDGSGNYAVGTITAPISYNSILLDTTRRHIYKEWVAGTTTSTDWGDHVWYASGDGVLISPVIVDWDIKNDTKTTYYTSGVVSNLSVNSDFTKFVFTSGGYVRIFDIATKTKSFITKDGMPITKATYATYDKDGNIWYTYKYGTTTMKVEKYDGTNFSHGIVLSTGIRDIEISDEGDLYLATTTGIYVYDFDANPIITVDNNTSLSTIVVDNASYKWYYSESAPGLRTSSTFTEVLGATSYSYTPTQSGYYKVGITQISGIAESDSVLFGNVTTGVENKISESDLILYPNPNSGTFNIATSFDVVEVMLTNQLGQTEKAIFNGTDITTAMKGLIIVSIKTNKGVTTKRMIIQ